MSNDRKAPLVARPVPSGLPRTASDPAVSDAAKQRDFGEVLRHELNNPLTGILGNAELLLVDVRRNRLVLPGSAEHRLEVIAALAVRMRETVRQLSAEWKSRSEEAERETLRRPG